MLETTALGAARLAIMGLNNNGSTLKNETATKFHQTAPKWQAEHRKARIERWDHAVSATRLFAQF